MRRNGEMNTSVTLGERDVPRGTLPPGMPSPRVNAAAGMSLPGMTAPSVMRITSLVESGRLRTVELDLIDPNPKQPRTRFDPEALDVLAESIKARGILQPPVVRPVGERYELVAGERRCKAAKLAGLTGIEVLVSDHDSSASLTDALMENVAREDLTPIETARAYWTCIDDLKITQDELAQRVGKNRVTVANHLRLLKLPDEALTAIDAGKLSYAHGIALLRCEDHSKRKRLVKKALREGLTTRALADEADAANTRQRATVPRVAPGDAAAPASGDDADANALADALKHALGAVTGGETQVVLRGDGTFRYEGVIASPEAAVRFASRLGVPLDARNF